MKTCTKCDISKALPEFRTRKDSADGHRNQCRACQKANEDAWRIKNQAHVNARSQSWVKRNPEKRAAIIQAYEDARPGRAKERAVEYRLKNRQKSNAAASRWSKNNPGTRNAITARRRAARLQRTPKWLTAEERSTMAFIYQMAKALQDSTGIAHHVDHILPLQGKLVSGLHVLSNLQILTASENCSKSNRWSGKTS